MKTRNELIEKYNTICLLLPLYRNIPARTYQHMMDFLLTLTQIGFKPAIAMVKDTYLPAARNHLTEKFSLIQGERRAQNKKEIKLILWADADNNFTVNDFFELLKSFEHENASIMSARYLMKKNNIICAFNFHEDLGYYPVEKERTGIQEVDGIGFGMLLMKPFVLENLYLKHGKGLFQTPYIKDKNMDGIEGEDFFFCKLAQKEGFEINVNHNVKIGHEGGELRG